MLKEYGINPIQIATNSDQCMVSNVKKILFSTVMSYNMSISSNVILK